MKYAHWGFWAVAAPFIGVVLIITTALVWAYELIFGPPARPYDDEHDA